LGKSQNQGFARGSDLRDGKYGSFHIFGQANKRPIIEKGYLRLRLLAGVFHKRKAGIKTMTVEGRAVDI
jgi:hypothetical protein